jgi:hypothetical protein
MLMRTITVLTTLEIIAFIYEYVIPKEDCLEFALHYFFIFFKKSRHDANRNLHTDTLYRSN